MTLTTTIRALTTKDIPMIVAQFEAHDWPKPASTFKKYLSEQTSNERCVWLAFLENHFAGYVTLTWQSLYASFKQKHIPEIMDLNVLPPYRNKGIGSLLMEIAEQEAFTRSETVGIGVGLYTGYGNAQKLYIARAYKPDGLGITYNYQYVEPGKTVCLDDNLVLWFTKKKLSTPSLKANREAFSTQNDQHFMQMTPELTCSNIKISLSFYIETLGFSIQYQREEEKFAMLERQGACIMLDEIKKDNLSFGRTWLSGPLEKPFGRGINLEIKTVNVIKLYDRVQKAGAKIFLPIEEKWYRVNQIKICNRQFIVLDPDGYMLRFSEYLGERLR